MLQISFKNKSQSRLAIVLAALISIYHWSSASAAADQKSPEQNKIAPELRLGMKDLFSHKSHGEVFKGNSISCTDCHSFAIKSPSKDPLATNVGANLINPSKRVCHECHMGKVNVARVNQCTLCHKSFQSLKPADHSLGWKERHGRFAQMDSDSCTACHSENQNSCLNCHTVKNNLKPSVHRPNFRMFHSIEARANPASCVTCHSTTSTCAQCHKGFP